MIDFRDVAGECDLYFLRHGESEGNVQGRAQGRADFPLSAEGEAQAVAAARWFEARDIQAIISSPLSRAKETAEIVGRELERTVAIEHNLTELDIGRFSGMSFDEMERSDPSAWRSFRQHSWEGVPTAERIASLTERAMAVWQAMFALVRGGKRKVLAVTHSGILQWIVKVTLGSIEWLPLFPMSNCGIYHFYISNGTFSADQAGSTDTPHHYAAWRLLNHVAGA